MKDIRNLLLSLNGVKTVSEIYKSDRKKIINLEKNYERDGAIGLKNLGIRMIMECDIVYAILKNTSFRPPPDPTVIMVEDYKESDTENDHLLTIADKTYRVIGEELINNKTPSREEYIFISNDFILYPERRSKETTKPAYFLIPPIKFTELEEIKNKLMIDNIMSISPSALTDDYIRKISSFSLSNKLATILIGFNKRN